MDSKRVRGADRSRTKGSAAAPHLPKERAGSERTPGRSNRICRGEFYDKPEIARAIRTEIEDEAAGAEGPRGGGSRREADFAELHAILSAGGEERTRRACDRCGRERISRFRRGNCGGVDRALPSRSGGGDPETVRGTDSHLMHRFLLRGID